MDQLTDCFTNSNGAQISFTKTMLKNGTKKDATSKFMSLMMFQKAAVINLKQDKHHRHKHTADKLFEDIKVTAIT